MLTSGILMLAGHAVDALEEHMESKMQTLEPRTQEVWDAISILNLL